MNILILKVLVLLIAFLNGIFAANIKETANLSGSRCPTRSNKPGIYLYSDKKLCNVYHECNCTDIDSTCSLVKTHVCPVGTIFLNLSNKCEPIELFGCETSYLQTINLFQSKSNNRTLEKDMTIMRKDGMNEVLATNLLPELANITGTSEFLCPQGVNERFPDPNICNIFHVCVSRGDQTYDQPFLCPFSSVFRVVDSKTMYCDRRAKNDCVGKAFYRSIDEDEFEFVDELNSLIETNLTNNCAYNDKMEDETYCNVYHSCKDNKDYSFVCESQLLFNPISKICDYPINVPCYDKQIYKKNDKISSYKFKPNVKSDENATNEKPSAGATSVSSSSQGSQNLSMKNGTIVTIFGTKIELICPSGSKNYLIPDKTYCNVFHHCHGGSGNVFICEKGQAFDVNANGPNNSGVCNFEDMVNCGGKIILLESGERPAHVKVISRLTVASEKQSYISNFNYQPMPNPHEELVSGIPFDCRRKSNGHWKDSRYCDVFHACIGGEQKKTYSCAQLGERIYFDENTRRCEFLKNNPAGCGTNMYFQVLTKSQPTANSIVSDEPNEAWKNFIRSREHFSCTGRMDGFYASRWCNVFYRCFIGVKTEFLCPKMLNSDRLWWVQHGSSQETPQNSAACVWPCETKKQCFSPGGSVVENGDGNYEESPSEADRVWRTSNCAETAIVSDIFKIPDQDFSCIGMPEGNFYPSKYCNVFHRCTSGKRKDFQCAKATNSPYDLWWNELTNQCDWPCKVQCSKPVYGTPKLAIEIQTEDRSLNEEECRRAKVMPLAPMSPVIPIAPIAPIPSPNSGVLATTQGYVSVPSKLIAGSNPDEGYICRGIGFMSSQKYCNVYYDCKQYGQSPQSSYYCIDGHFDNISKTCKITNLVQCSLNPQLLYPIVSIAESNPPEEVGCSNTLGPYIIHSNRYCNIYYACDGRSPKPSAYRCYDRDRLEDAVYNRDSRKCESKQSSQCQGEILTIKLRYQSSPVDYTRLPDLQPLSCRADQQYLAEHDKYCNLYHSCILGKYQMYVCVTVGSFDKTSYFYYTNGDCAAPSAAQCGPNKTVYPYEKLFPNEGLGFKNGFNQNGRYVPIVSPSMAYKGQASFGSVSLKYNLPYSPVCANQKSSYLIAHPKYCNLFYECYNGKLTTFACVDSSTGQFSGIFDEKVRGCKPYSLNDCPSNSIYNPEETNMGKSEEFESFSDMRLAAPNIQPPPPPSSPQIQPTEAPFKTESTFSCKHKPNGYYESEWCNVFFRCLNGKRIDTKCSSGLRNSESSQQYDLWWEYQNVTYDPNNPVIFIGLDEDAKCEWPCKIKCNKPVWVDNNKYQSSKLILERDVELHPECSKNSQQNSQSVAVASALSSVSQFHAVEAEAFNPSGYYCETDGTFKDPLFCNIFHVCNNKERKTYQCKSLLSENQQDSLFDSEKGLCVSKADGFAKCNGVIYDSNFMNLPAYRDIPIGGSCVKEGVFRAYDKDVKYCDLYYWCEKSFSEPLYFYCDFAVFGNEMAFFNPETKKCEMSSSVKCDSPFKIYSNSLQSRDTTKEAVVMHDESDSQQPSPKSQSQPSPYMAQIVSGLLDPAPGYLSLTSAQFQTSFICPYNSPGYYPNNEYCDIFHYCYGNGQFKTYVCASMQNQYQLWWSHQTEPGRRDNIFCDWPCNLVGPNSICPPEKKVLMRDRQQIPGGISQEEVLISTCPNTENIQAAFKPKSQPTTARPPLYSPPVVSINTPNSYAPCSNSGEWYVSPQIIKCTPEYKLHGFAPDPRDCSKFYRCEQSFETDDSIGYLMSCVAGLWWNQARRMCEAPSEIPCNPYHIINTQGNTNVNQVINSACRGLSCAQVGLAMKNQMKNIPGKPSSFFKCDGQCAIEMTCPLDLIFDNKSQRCEWTQSQNKMSSLKSLEFLKEKLKNELNFNYLNKTIDVNNVNNKNLNMTTI